MSTFAALGLIGSGINFLAYIDEYRLKKRINNDPHLKAQYEELLKSEKQIKDFKKSIVKSVFDDESDEA